MYIWAIYAQFKPFSSIYGFHIYMMFSAFIWLFSCTIHSVHIILACFKRFYPTSLLVPMRRVALNSMQKNRSNCQVSRLIRPCKYSLEKLLHMVWGVLVSNIWACIHVQLSIYLQCNILYFGLNGTKYMLSSFPAKQYSI